jgi:hypothetical protein
MTDRSKVNWKGPQPAPKDLGRLLRVNLDSVDTSSPRFLGRFELLWAHAAKVTVAAGLIVEAIDVVGHIV